MKQRLQKLLADAGLGSRRGCEALIVEGRVSVNRRVITELGAAADPDRDVVALDGERIRPAPKMYLMLNKPPGFLCTSRDEKGRPTVHRLLKGVRGRVYTVGRLDADAEGLLLLTNDGDFAQRDVLVDPGIQWNRLANLRHSAAIRSSLYMPFYMLKKCFPVKKGRNRGREI